MTDTRCWNCNARLGDMEVTLGLAACDACHYRYQQRCDCEGCIGVGGHTMGCRDRRASAIRAYRAAHKAPATDGEPS